MASNPENRTSYLLQSLFGNGASVLQETNFRLLLLMNMCPILGVSLISPVLDSLIGPFETSAANIGLMISLFTAPAIFMIPIAGVLADRYGRKPVLIASLLLFGAGGTLIAFTTEYRLALALRFVQGIGFGGLFPVITTSIGDIYDGVRETAAQGFRVTIGGISATVFPLLAGSLVVISWKYPFGLYAVAFPIAAVVYLWFDEPATTQEDGQQQAHGDRSYHRALFALVRQRRVLPVVIARGLPQAVWTGFLTYNSIIVVQFLNGNPFEAGILVAVGSLVFSLIASQVGRIMARFETRVFPLIGGNICLGVGLVIVLFAPNVLTAIGGAASLGIGMGTTMSLYRSLLTSLGPTSLRAGLVGLAATGDRIITTVTPIAMGGIIASATPLVGFTEAIRLAGIGTAVFGGGGGIVCLLFFRVAARETVTTAVNS